MRNAGFRATARGLRFALEWGMATAELGREPESIEEFAEIAQESRATAFRNQQAFRRAFPGEESPARMNEVSGNQARYEELYRSIMSWKKVMVQAEPLIFTLGASPAI